MINLFRNAGTRPVTISPQDAVARCSAGEATLIDVRDGNELKQTGRAEGAIHIPLAVLAMRADPRSPELHPSLSVEKPVVIYCMSGARSDRAGQLMMQMGYRQVYNLGGLGHWRQGGGKIVR